MPTTRSPTPRNRSLWRRCRAQSPQETRGMTGTVGLLTTAAGRSGRFSPGGREGRRRPGGGADPGRSPASRPRSETGLGPVVGGRVGIGASAARSVPSDPASASGAESTHSISPVGSKSPTSCISGGSVKAIGMSSRPPSSSKAGLRGTDGAGGAAGWAMGCAVARRFPHHKSDIGVPDTLPCASPARGAPAGRRRDTAGPGRAPKGPIPAGQSARGRGGSARAHLTVP